MKRNAIFDEYAAKVPPEVYREFSLNIDIADRLFLLIGYRKMTLDALMEATGYSKRMIGRMLKGSHCFTTKEIAKLSTALGEPLVTVPDTLRMSPPAGNKMAR